MRKSRTILKAKEPIKLRTKDLANGNKSLYLDLYNTETKKRSYEFLNLYLIHETSPGNRITNEVTLQLANTIKAQRIVEMQTQNSGLSVRKQTKVNLIEFVSGIANKAFSDTKNKRSEYYTFNSLAYHLKAYKGDSLNITDIDKVYINGFIDYLKTANNGNFQKSTDKTKNKNTPISQNTAHKLFAKFSTVLKKAVQDEIIGFNPMQKIDDKVKPKTKPSKREYLTLDEIKILIDTDCTRPDIKNAFLFCCLVGIRFENVKNITLSDIVTDRTGNTILSYKQIKVNTFESLPISKEALKFIHFKPDQKPGDRVFDLPKNETVNDVIRLWTTEARINKNITFHCSRHTAATLQLSLGTPIETVSKLLGHSKISTTQIYAKIINKNKVDAVNQQNGIFDQPLKAEII